MDERISWSSFEKHDNQSDLRNTSSSCATDTSFRKGVNALFTSSSSPDVSPAASALLRDAALTSVSISKRSDGTSIRDDGFESTENEGFNFRFHWVRPHPSLLFALEGEKECIENEGGDIESGRDGHTRQRINNNSCKNEKPKDGDTHPCIHSAELVQIERYSQMMKKRRRADETATSEQGNSDTNNNDLKGSIDTASITSDAPKHLQGLKFDEGSHLNLPLEMPTLRINLANLIDPPLMTSWLPFGSDGEDDDINTMA